MTSKYEYHEQGMKACSSSEDTAKGKKKARKKRAKNTQSQASESDVSRESGED